jgi:hypothetical protein
MSAVAGYFHYSVNLETAPGARNRTPHLARFLCRCITGEAKIGGKRAAASP